MAFVLNPSEQQQMSFFDSCENLTEREKKFLTLGRFRARCNASEEETGIDLLMTQSAAFPMNWHRS